MLLCTLAKNTLKRSPPPLSFRATFTIFNSRSSQTQLPHKTGCPGENRERLHVSEDKLFASLTETANLREHLDQSITYIVIYCNFLPFS